MKNKIILQFTVAFIMLFTSCKPGTQSSQTGGVDVDINDAIKTAESRRGTDPDASGGNTCLLGYQTKYDELLTADMIIAATGFSKDVMKMKYSKGTSSPEYHTITYEFKNKRKAFIPTLNEAYVIEDKISIGSIKPMSISQFKQSYKVPTAAENEISNTVIEDATEGKSESEEANQKVKDLEKQGVSKNTMKDVGSMMKEGFNKINAAYVVVEGLGDAASWNTYSNELEVLKNGVKFRLYVLAKDGPDGDKDLAITLAKEILAKCK